ncbi:3-oxoacyl-ACP reductase FabG [soil metagenome]
MAITIDLTGKIVLVTGGSQGIGAAIVRCFHQAGANVLINHPGLEQTDADAQALASELGSRASVLAADISNPNAVQAMMQSVNADLGGLDFLINNAAILRDRSIAKMSLNEWSSVIDINLSGTFYTCKYGLEIMRDHGAIVSLGSIAGLIGFYGQANYAAAKSGVMSMMRVLSREAARRGIRANSIAPGVIETSMAATIPAEVRARMLTDVPLNRFGTPDEIAHAALFLCSPLASYITGQTLEVNGGWHG